MPVAAVATVMRRLNQIYTNISTNGRHFAPQEMYFCVMDMPQPNNPLHGKTLEMMLNDLVRHYGWEIMCERVRINCFYENPSISSSLKFLRKTPWARKKVEDLYLEYLDTLPNGQ